MLERVKGYWLGIKFKLKLISWEERLEGLIDVKGIYAHVAAVNMQALSRYRPSVAEGPACCIALICAPTGRAKIEPIQLPAGRLCLLMASSA